MEGSGVGLSSSQEGEGHVLGTPHCGRSQRRFDDRNSSRVLKGLIMIRNTRNKAGLALMLICPAL